MPLRFVVSLSAILAAAVAIAACGGGGSSTATDSTAVQSTGTGSSAESGVQAEATASLQKFLTIPTSVSWIKTKLPQPPPTGKTIDVMDCGVGACTAWAEAVEEAASALGWKTKRITQGVTPQEITAAWNQAARELPDAVFTIGIPKVLFPQQLATLEEHEIPVLNADVDEGTGEGQVLSLQGRQHALEIGQAWADWIVSKEGEEADVLSVTSPEFPITEAFAEGFEKALAKSCSSCEVTEVQVSAAQVGSGQNANKIVAALRSNPNVNYIVSNDEIATGLAPAMIAAGIETPWIGQVCSAAGIEALQEENPVYKACVAFPPFETAWQMVDWAARSFSGQPTKPAEAEEPAFIVTPETVDPDATNYYPFIPSWDEEFKALWGV